jgi:C4-dicarboxylate-specific signal transduction histidine kinase
MKNTKEIDNITQLQNDLNNIQSLAKIGFWRLDLNKQKLHWTDEMYQIFDMVKRKDRPLEIKDFLNSIYTYDGLQYIDKYNEHLENKKPYHSIHRIVTRKKQIKWVEERCETEFDSNGEPLVSIGTIQDITEQKEKELLFKQQQDYMYQQQRFAQIGEMLTMIAHQWRSPLSHIGTAVIDAQMNFQLGKFDFQSQDGIEECKKSTLKKFDEIASYVSGMSKTIDEFSEFYKPETKKTLTTLEDVIQKSIHLLEPILRLEGVRLKTNIETLDKIELSYNEISQVLTNLIKNSIDNFNRKELTNRYIEISALKIDNAFKIILKDNGGGIIKEHLDKVFDPYFSQKEEKNGKGLGLYMSKIIIENYNGGKLNISNGFEGIICEIVLFGKTE